MHVQPDSTTQEEEHPSFETVFASSQISGDSMTPSPHSKVHVEGAPTQAYPVSTMQAEHPSALAPLLSSQSSSPEIITPSPQSA